MAALPDSTTVLIVGAGPAGLATAISLVHHGCRDLVVVDAISEGANTSRAIVVHAATLEVLDNIGIGDDIISNGVKLTDVHFKTRLGLLVRPDFSLLKPFTRHPYYVRIPQYMTERVLEKKLASFGISVYRGLTVVGMKCNVKNNQLTDVRFQDGRVVSARYVVGADGARSVVRTTACIGFNDPTPELPASETNLAQTVLADVSFDTLDVETHFTLSPKSLFLCLPLPSDTSTDPLYRIGAGVPMEEGDIPSSPSKEYLQSVVDRFGPLGLSSDPSMNSKSKSVRIKEVVWSTRFRNHAAVSDTHFTRLSSPGKGSAGGAILLVGDAAHIHAPIGGQGMNLGLRDAVSLGEALAEHIQATAIKPLSEADLILRDWAAVRHSTALKVIALTKRILSIMGTRNKQFFSWWLPVRTTTVRNWGLWFAGMFPYVRRRMAWEISGLGRR